MPMGDPAVSAIAATVGGVGRFRTGIGMRFFCVDEVGGTNGGSEDGRYAPGVCL